jgi:hypothetical protein
LGGCVELGGLAAPNVGSAQAPPAGSDQWRAYADEWGKRYDQNPGDKTASINYARGLRALTRYSEAAAVMRTAAVDPRRISRCSASTARRSPIPEN